MAKVEVKEEERVVLVTGGNRGIGLLCCQILADAGLTVYGSYRSDHPEEKDDKDKKEQNKKKKSIKWVKMDVTNVKSVKDTIKTIIDHEKRLDIVVNNSGTTTGICPTENTPLEIYREVMEVNYFGVINVIQAVAAQMRKQKSGLIINISSCISLVTLPFLGAYCSSKAAVDRLTEAAYHELKDFGIRVCLVSPGPVKTEFDKNIQSLLKEADESYSEQLKIFGENSHNIIKNAIEPESVAECVLKK